MIQGSNFVFIYLPFVSFLTEAQQSSFWGRHYIQDLERKLINQKPFLFILPPPRKKNEDLLHIHTFSHSLSEAKVTNFSLHGGGGGDDDNEGTNFSLTDLPVVVIVFNRTRVIINNSLKCFLLFV